MAKDSAGWRVGFPNGSGDEYILDEKGESIAVLRWGCGCCKNNDPLSKVKKERARLIAAAPNLLKALKAVMKDLMTQDSVSNATSCRAFEAIGKATAP